MALAETLPRWWYRRGLALPLLPLVPLSWLFGAVAGLRRAAYRSGLRQSERLRVPIIVVGNLIAGGAGKTPLVLAIAEALKAAGWRPGIISRGYGVDVAGPRLVDPEAVLASSGDEPQLLARRSGLPVAVCRDRVAAGRFLLAERPETNVLISDDGLQHYRLARDVEIAVFDGRGAGNGHLLPAGPLREPLTRLAALDAIVLNGGDVPENCVSRVGGRVFDMRLKGDSFVSLADPAQHCGAEGLRGKRLHAFAGIGDPARFFRHLASLGLEVVAHPFPDHHAYAAADFADAAGGVILLTEKDAVKCAGLIKGEAWVLPVSAELSPGLIERILEKIDGRKAA